MHRQSHRPAFTGLVVYRNVKYRFSLLYPEGWHVRESPTPDGHGAVFSPEPNNLDTSFSLEAKDVGTVITAKDLPTLRQGLLAGLRQLNGARIENLESDTVGSLISLEARCTYQTRGTRRPRWVRLLYQGARQVALSAQGATVEEFTYWLPMFNQAMRTFRFGDWWAEATGREWLPSLDGLGDAT